MLADDTIAAISTPPGEGAIAVLRLTGPQALAVADRVFRGKKAASSLADRQFALGGFFHGDDKVDEGLIVTFRGPRSYTGEDMVEFHCHGGALVTSCVYEAILTAGARAADPGEFSQRAFLNRKMDLTQAEAVMDVIRASTPQALKSAQEQLAGRLGAEIEQIRALLLATVAHLEAYIDFPDEDIAPHVGAQLLDDMSRAAARIQALLATAHEGRILREGVRLVLCGKPNAGKSSLLNRLLGFERAIVSAIPGTTRDTIEEFASLRGLPFRITDTAGLRETADTVEQEGVLRAQQAIDRADVVVHVVDATGEIDPPAAEGEILVLNKVDLLDQPPTKGIPVSCLTGAGLELLVDAIVTKTRGQHSSEAPTLAAINARHQACLNRAGQTLALAMTELQNESALELVALPLRESLDAVGEVVGQADAEEILGQIFSTFCIGK